MAKSVSESCQNQAAERQRERTPSAGSACLRATDARRPARPRAHAAAAAAAASRLLALRAGRLKEQNVRKDVTLGERVGRDDRKADLAGPWWEEERAGEGRARGRHRQPSIESAAGKGQGRAASYFLPEDEREQAD